MSNIQDEQVKQRIKLRKLHEEHIQMIEKKLKSLEAVHGFEKLRTACNRYINKQTAKDKLEREIEEKEQELKKLKGAI